MEGLPYSPSPPKRKASEEDEIVDIEGGADELEGRKKLKAEPAEPKVQHQDPHLDFLSDDPPMVAPHLELHHDGHGASRGTHVHQPHQAPHAAAPHHPPSAHPTPGHQQAQKRHHSPPKQASGKAHQHRRPDAVPLPSSGEIIKIVQANSNEIVNIDDDAPDSAGVTAAQEPAVPAPNNLSSLPPPPPGAEKPKLCIQNIPKVWNQRRFIRLLADLKITYDKAKKVHMQNFGFITFPDLASKETAACILRNAKGQQWHVSETKNFKMMKEDTVHHALEKAEEKKPAVAAAETPSNTSAAPPLDALAVEDGDAPVADLALLASKTARDVVTPFWAMPYDEQLKMKLQEVKKILLEVTKSIVRESHYSVPLWLQALKGTPCCPLDGDRVLPSPRTAGYRNKVAWAIGFDVRGKPVIGHLLGQTKDGVTAVADAADCPNVPPEAEQLRLVMQEFVLASGIRPWHKLEHTGVWRTLTVRTTEGHDVMAILQADCHELPDIEATKKALTEHLVAGAQQRGIKLKSIFFQDFRGVSNAAPPELPYDLLHGDEVITETLLGRQFRISPNSFFQVNTKAAEVLYSLVADWCASEEQTTVMDIYCGTGSIGICISNRVHEVCGIEIVEAAVADAKANAKLNGITNAAFFAGKAEDLLGQKLRDWARRSPNFVGIVDPPRAGLHHEAIRSIRACRSMRRLIYVSCNPKELVRNAAALCRAESKTLKGMPFRPVKAAAVDLFPHTDHCEMVMLFEREEPPRLDASTGPSASPLPAPALASAAPAAEGTAAAPAAPAEQAAATEETKAQG